MFKNDKNIKITYVEFGKYLSTVVQVQIQSVKVAKYGAKSVQICHGHGHGAMLLVYKPAVFDCFCQRTNLPDSDLSFVKLNQNITAVCQNQPEDKVEVDQRI